MGHIQSIDQSTNERMDLGMRIWDPQYVLQGQVTSSSTWQRRESLGLTDHKTHSHSYLHTHARTHAHWLIHSHITSNNGTVCRQKAMSV